MIRPARLAGALVLSAALGPWAVAQVPSAAEVRNHSAAKPVPTNGARSQPEAMKIKRRSIVHYNPSPYPGYYRDDTRGGFRNPGGVGRALLWYPAGNHYQVDNGRDPVHVATFNGAPGGMPTMQEIIAGQSVGVQKYNAIQQHIDNYARPYYGYGLGVGYFGGFF